MATSIRLVLRTKINKEGKYPLAIRITKDRKSTFIYTGHYIDKKHWDEKNRSIRKSYPNSTRLNNLLLSKLSEAQGTLVDMQSNDKIVSSKKVKSEIVDPMSQKSYNEISEAYLQELLMENKLTRLSSDKPRVNHVINFAQTDNLSFQDIDEDFLRRFRNYLKTKRKVSERSVINNFVVIRTIYNRAIKMGVVDQKLYPFGKDKIRIKFPETEKIGLNKDEVVLLENLTNLTPQEAHVRNVWFFSFYLAGMRVADLLKIRWSDMYDGRLHYRMDKNDKLLSLKLPHKVLPIIKEYEASKEYSNDFIFPEMKKADLSSPQDILIKTKTATKKFNKYLEVLGNKAGINKKLTMHIARHTFGNISGDAISIQTLQKLYRHSSITTTINYQSNFTHKDEDYALDSVLNF